MFQFVLSLTDPVVCGDKESTVHVIKECTVGWYSSPYRTVVFHYPCSNFAERRERYI